MPVKSCSPDWHQWRIVSERVCQEPTRIIARITDPAAKTALEDEWFEYRENEPRNVVLALSQGTRLSVSNYAATAVNQSVLKDLIFVRGSPVLLGNAVCIFRNEIGLSNDKSR
jgi:hypothetical protein